MNESALISSSIVISLSLHRFWCTFGTFSSTLRKGYPWTTNWSKGADRFRRRVESWTQIVFWGRVSIVFGWRSLSRRFLWYLESCIHWEHAESKRFCWGWESIANRFRSSWGYGFRYFWWRLWMILEMAYRNRTTLKVCLLRTGKTEGSSFTFDWAVRAIWSLRTTPYLLAPASKWSVPGSSRHRRRPFTGK